MADTDNKQLQQLLAVVKQKSEFDQTNPWYKGAETYLEGIKSELDEVAAEMAQHRLCYLEDKLADVLWNYLNLIQNVTADGQLSLTSVIQRANHKYQARVNAIQAGQSWDDIKTKQKLDLANEFELECLTKNSEKIKG